MYTYLLLNFFSISIPFVASFDKRLPIRTNFKALFAAIAVVGAFFIVWDVVFTHWGIWGFNPKYLSGIYLFKLPLGEWLFFICIPYACVFTYTALNYLVKKDYFKPHQRLISVILILALGVVAILNITKWYTATTFILTSLFIAYLEFYSKPKWLSRFYFAYLIILIPFFIVNGILTGTGIEEEVVWYNDAENLGFRLGTIPVEDTFYGLLLILMNVFFFEKWKNTTPNLEGE